MNVIKVKVNFSQRTSVKQGVDLTEGDYNSTKMVFDFDTDEGTKIFQMKNPSDEIVLEKEIINNEVILTGKADVTTTHNEKTYVKYLDDSSNVYWYNSEDEELYDSTWTLDTTTSLDTLTKQTEDASIFTETGSYVYEISLYDGDSKLTSASDKIKVKKKQIGDDSETAVIYKPVFDELVSEFAEAIEEIDNIDIDASKSGDTATITITDKTGAPKTVQIKDGAKGDTGATGAKGDKGDKGDKGNTGDRGPQGIQGVKGDKGDKGDTGSQGQQGIAGNDAKINGVNTLSIEAGTNISIDQEGSTLIINSTGGSGGTSDYSDLTNKPSINNITLSGNKTSSDLGLQPAGNYLTSEIDPIFTASASYGITSNDITNWNGKGTYSKPSGGIPKTDLASAVQTSLGKADTAIQSLTPAILKDGGSSTQTVALTSGTGTTPLGIKSRSGSSYVSFTGTSGWLGSFGVSSDKKPIFYNGTGYTLAYTSDIPDVSGKENSSNKVTSISSSSTDTQYPSAKCVYDMIGDVETILTTLTTGSGV